MNTIVSVDNNWGIGCQGSLLARIPGDMRWFRQHTVGKVVVMGRNTLLSLPGGKPLADRANVVLSGNGQLQGTGLEVYPSLPRLLTGLLKYRSEDIYVIGGAQVYRLLLPYCHYAYVTCFRKAFAADCWFPDLNQDAKWQLEDISPVFDHEGQKYHFTIYRNITLRQWDGE